MQVADDESEDADCDEVVFKMRWTRRRVNKTITGSRCDARSLPE